MRLIPTFAGIALLLSAVTMPTEASARCRTIVVGGPMVRIIAPCIPVPPPVVVRVHPAPTPPPPPPPPAQPMETDPCPPPPAPPAQVEKEVAPRLGFVTLGMFMEGTMFKDGGLGGGSFYAQLRVSRALHLYGSLGAAGSCTNCNEDDLNRVDLKTTFGLQYYFLATRRFSPYLRGTLAYQSVRYKDPQQPDAEPVLRARQFGVEFAAGLELKVTHWLILGADVAYLGLKRVGEHEDVEGPLPTNAGQGVPTVNEFDHGATFRLNAAIRF